MNNAELSDDELIDLVRTWASRIARGTAELLDLIAELDLRGAWAVHGVTSCAHWLSWQLGWSDSTAREHVRVAHALRDLPLLREELWAGRLSYSQARAVTRIATPEDEPRWVELAKHCTGAQLDRIARGAARATAADRPQHEREPKRAAHVEWDEDGDLLLTLRIPAHEAVPVLEVLEQYKNAVQAEREAALRQLVSEGLPGGSGASAEASQLNLIDASVAATGEVELQPSASAEAPAEPVAARLAAEEAQGCDPLKLYPRPEPDYPIGPDRLGLRLTEAETASIRAWEGKRAEWRELRDAWNDRREDLLVAASAARLPSGRATLADAAVRALLSPQDGPRTTVRLLVDPLSGWARSQHDELLPPATLDQLVRALPRKQVRGLDVLRPAEPDVPPGDLTRFDVGRETRQVSPALRRLLGQLDGERCRFPGCRHTRFLHAHHLVYWRDGGPTDLSNLALLCTKHHRLVHSLGYQLTLDADRTLCITTPDGELLDRHPSLPDASAEALPVAGPDTYDRKYRGDRLDLGYVVNVMLPHAA